MSKVLEFTRYSSLLRDKFGAVEPIKSIKIDYANPMSFVSRLYKRLGHPESYRYGYPAGLEGATEILFSFYGEHLVTIGEITRSNFDKQYEMLSENHSALPKLSEDIFDDYGIDKIYIFKFVPPEKSRRLARRTFASHNYLVVTDESYEGNALKLAFYTSARYSVFEGGEFRYTILSFRELARVSAFVSIVGREAILKRNLDEKAEIDEYARLLDDPNSSESKDIVNLSQITGVSVEEYKNSRLSSRLAYAEMLVSEEGINDVLRDARRLLALYLMSGGATNFKGNRQQLDAYASYFIFDYVRVFEDEFNIQLSERYNEGTASDYARAWQTKKSIPASHLEAMSKSSFLSNGFSYVEFDADVDLDVISEIERQWEFIYGLVPQVSLEGLNLRFRKLGRHKAAGLWFPTQKCLAVDIRNPSSFIHEYGHCIDYSTTKGLLSLEPDFSFILSPYQKFIDDLDIGAKSSYFKTPTEVFARAFEVYMADILPELSLSKTKSWLESSEVHGYLMANLSDVQSYFDMVLKKHYGMERPVVNGSVEVKRVSSVVSEKAKQGALGEYGLWQGYLNGDGLNAYGGVPEELQNVTSWADVVSEGDIAVYVIGRTDVKTFNSRCSFVIVRSDKVGSLYRTEVLPDLELLEVRLVKASHSGESFEDSVFKLAEGFDNTRVISNMPIEFKTLKVLGMFSKVKPEQLKLIHVQNRISNRVLAFELELYDRAMISRIVESLPKRFFK